MSRAVLFVLRSLGMGGAERVAADIVAALRAAGHAGHVLSFGDGPGAVWFADASGRFALARNASPEALLRHIAELDIDTLVLCGPSPAYAALPLLRRARPTLRIVGFMFNARQLVTEHRALSAVIDAVIAESAVAAAALEGDGEERVPLSVVSSGIDLARVLARPRREPAAGPLVVGYVGRFDRSKNPAGFVALARRLRGDPRFRFVMAGPAPRLFRPPRQVRFAGPLTGEDKERFLDALDILVVPSRNDGRPLIIHEAQARGQVVVASRVGAIPDLIEDGVNGLLCTPGDVSGFATALTGLAADASLRARLGAAARGRVPRQGDMALALPRYLAVILGA